MKKLEDMNLVDDFLMTSLICHQEYGDRSVRYMLECILNRRFGKLTVVPQRVMCGADPEKHGIRMDVYIDENDGEVGLAYMKSVEIEKRIREEGREEGHRDGVRIGRIQEIVRLSRRFNKSDEEIIQILLEETGLGEDQARDALKKYS